jgi:hypothetical protein
LIDPQGERDKHIHVDAKRGSTWTRFACLGIRGDGGGAFPTLKDQSAAGQKELYVARRRLYLSFFSAPTVAPFMANIYKPLFLHTFNVCIFLAKPFDRFIT